MNVHYIADQLGPDVSLDDSGAEPVLVVRAGSMARTTVAELARALEPVVAAMAVSDAR